jgi:formamidopyrimidine-DNA glycosylase
MPELPEVETTRRGIEAAVVGRTIDDWVVRNAALRWPVDLPASLQGQRIVTLGRRGKYLLLHTAGEGSRRIKGGLIIHLGMSGSLRVVDANTEVRKHDHLDLILSAGVILRLHDPRRFGSLHYCSAPLAAHFLLKHLGVEPLEKHFSGAYLKAQAKGRRVAVKNFLMNAQVVVGVGNIYANEALFVAGIRPTTAAQNVTLAAYEALAVAVREVLQSAIQMGGTTLRDYVGGNGEVGYFKQVLNVYGREGEMCNLCDTKLKSLRLGQRATVYCPKCQRSRGFRQR